MVNIIEISSKKTRAFGWVQDSGNLDALCNVVAIFDQTSKFHKELKEIIIPELVTENNGKDFMISAMNTNPVAITYKLLTGGHSTPRCNSPCDGIVQASVKGQKREYISDWAADNFVRWAQAFGFISYNYDDDTFTITELGTKLVAVKSIEERTELLINAALAYPPAYRIMDLLRDSKTILTKFELGKQLGFT